MLNLFNNFKEIFFAALKQVASEHNIELHDSDFYNFIVEPAKDKAHGDLACNIAMTLSKRFSDAENLNNPRKLATKLIEKLDKKNGIVKLDIAGPGFINIFLESSIFYKILSDLLNAKKFDFPNLGHGEKINLEYASPNPTGPIHVGHTRGAIYGDVLASLLSKVGYDVLKEYYINDAGSQITSLIKFEPDNTVTGGIVLWDESKDQRFLNLIKGTFYPGDYLIPVGKALSEKFGDLLVNDNNYELKIRDFVVDEMLKMIVADLQALGIKHDSYFSEKKKLHDTNKIDEAISVLQKKDLIYVGKLEAPKTEKGVGALPEGYDEKDQTLFRSTKFGDDVDRVVKKADGSPTYLAGDMAYALSKFERGAKKFIMPLGFDHAGYVKRLSAVVQALTDGQAEVKVILCQMVKFVKDGEPLKMSKRAGNFITAREVIDEVGSDALRFIMLTRKNDAPFDFDLSKVIEQSKDNPIFYVQYAHARCCSVLRNLNSMNNPQLIPNQIDEKLLQNLTCESEMEIIKKIIAFPRAIEMAAVSFEPHRIAFYLQEFAALFHALWNKGVDNPDLKFIIADKPDVTKARIALIMAVKIIIAAGLDIFNIKAVEEMR